MEQERGGMGAEGHLRGRLKIWRRDVATMERNYWMDIKKMDDQLLSMEKRKEIQNRRWTRRKRRMKQYNTKVTEEGKGNEEHGTEGKEETDGQENEEREKRQGEMGGGRRSRRGAEESTWRKTEIKARNRKMQSKCDRLWQKQSVGLKISFVHF